jgi:hypothetical protein
MNLTRFSSNGFQGQLMKTHIGPMWFKSHYKINPLLEFDSLEDALDDSSMNVEFLSNKSRRIFVIFSTMNSLNEDPDVCSQTDWNSVLLSLFMKVAFKAIVCICNQKSFNNLVVTL